jgi:hypothetical protein
MSNTPVASAPLTRVRLGSPAELIASVPYLLGFHPHESVVAIGLRGRRSRVCLTLRLDLPAPESERPLADLVATHLRTARATNAVLLILTETPPPPGELQMPLPTGELQTPPRAGELQTPLPSGELPRASLARELRASLDRSRIGVRDVVCVQAGRWWSYVCTDVVCCPPEGKPVAVEAPGALAAAMVAEGRVVHADRDGLVASLAPDRDEEAMRVHFAEAERKHRAVPTVARQAVVAQLEARLTARTDAVVPLTDAEAADLCVALSDVEVRDACLRWLDGPLADPAEGLWLELARAAVAPYAAPVAILLSLFAYARGDGTYARIAADRALADVPGYAMAQLVLQGLDQALPPAMIRELASCVEPAGADT